jgi:cytochrome d ubiquinol oxidase subunit I
MVGVGLLMVATGLWSLLLRLRGRLYEAPLFLRCVVAMGPAGFLAVLSGWVTTEVGRQPYTVYGLLRTSESVSAIAAPAVGASLVMFVLVYLLVFGAGTLYILRLMAATPEAGEPRVEGPVRAAGITPAAQLAGAADHGGKDRP